MSESGQSVDVTSDESRLRSVRSDLVAGIINAVVSIPDGLASATLAGVNPIYGLYTSIAAPTTGSLLVSAQLMQVATTSASALAAGQAIASYPDGERAEALFLLVLLVGVWLALFGLLRMGRLVRFVSHAVMTGFLMGVAVVLILSQTGPLVGVNAEGSNEVTQFLDLLSRIPQFNGPTVLTGLLALGLALGLQRTRFANVASLIALIIPALFVALLSWESVEQVADVNPIPRGLPTPSLPNLALISPGLIFSAFSVAVVIAVQGAGVSQVTENPDGSDVDPSRDMFAQGAANVTSGLLSGIPAGGSVGQTALNISVGARSRLAGVFSGVWMLGIVLLIPGLVGQVPMTVLAALMIQAGLGALNLSEVRSIWNTNRTARWSILVTFLATLVLSVPLAVAVGVVLSIVLYLASSASDVRVRALIPRGDGRFAEGVPPDQLPSNAVTILDVYGSLFFAGARTLEDQLPSIEDATRPVVILRVRGRTRAGATLIDVLDEYADELDEVGGRLYLSGVSDELRDQLRDAGKLDVAEAVQLVPADEVLGESTAQALERANAWLGRKRGEQAQTQHE